jgi:TolB-like protein/DNA-binding winged helix-turn-helix (wHTH) protein
MIRFGRFQVDVDAGELLGSGVKIRLQQQSFQILVALLERGGDVASREDLKHKLWTDDTFVDFDNGLNIAVKKLRMALGDNAESPHFIETIPKRGYRFIAPFEQDVPHKPAPQFSSPGQSLPSPAPSAQPAVESRPLGKASRVLFPIAVGLAVATLLCLTWIVIERRQHYVQAAVGPAVQSIAVLPLQNLSGDPAQEYFADAITEQVINDLAQDDSLRVISRTSAMHYKGTNGRLSEIARELKVDVVMEGAVMQAGGHVRVTAQLIQVNEDKHFWAATFERNLRDTLDVQRDLARNIAAQIRISLKSRRPGLARVAD